VLDDGQNAPKPEEILGSIRGNDEEAKQKLEWKLKGGKGHNKRTFDEISGIEAIKLARDWSGILGG
jgi:hypothetical protein